MAYIANYHTHHRFCNHAEGSVEDYVKTALNANLKHLGFSDHAPSLLLEDQLRMSFNELPIYIHEIEAIALKYQKEITLYKGLECEYLDLNSDYYRKLLKQVDYLILGQHYIGRKTQKFTSSYALTTKTDILTYQKEIVSGIESGHFIMVAHPDLYLYAYPTFDETAKHVAKTIVTAAVKHNMVLEYNANGIRKGTRSTKEGIRYYYPRQEFWEIVAEEKKCRVIVSADAHRPKEIYDEAIAEAYAHLLKLGIKPLERLDIKNP